MPRKRTVGQIRGTSAKRRKTPKQKRRLVSKRYIRGARLRFGSPVGYGTAKSTVTSSTPNIEVLRTRTLYSRDLTFIDKGIDNDINERQRDLVDLRGFKLCFYARNNSSLPLYFNMAVIVSRDGQGIGNADFFRGYNGDRSVDFNGPLQPFEYFQLPINTDKYDVLFHKRYIIHGPNVVNGQTHGGAAINYRHIMKYVKIKRQVNYDGAAGGSAQQKLFQVWWCDISTNGIANIAGGIGQYHQYNITFFKEPKV